MSTPDTVRDIFAADEARYQALYAQDLDRLALMLHEDYVHTHANGKTENKEAFLASIKAAKYRFLRADRADQIIRILSPVAFLHGRTNTTIEVGGETKTLHNAFVTAWARSAGDEWKMLHWQATKIVEG